MVDSYGTGDKPLINCAGAHQEAVFLYNQEYWEISNLEITNYDSSGPDVRQGVRVLGEDAGTLDHIHLRNLDIHDVNGDMTTGRDGGKCNAGILVDVVGSTTPTRFNDVLIEGCFVHDLERTAIKFWSDWGNSCTSTNVTLHTNIVIRNCVVDNYRGDGICPHQADGVLVEYNVSSNGCYETSLANAALWTWSTRNAVFQYNEVYGTVQTRDGMAFDIDGCSENVTMQYNYSHDNAGGALMVIGVPDCAAAGSSYVRLPFCTNNRFRYNISQRDGTRILRFVGKIQDNYIYNNTIYVGAGDPHVVDSGSCGSPAQYPDATYLYNNIIYNTESSGADYQLNGTNYVWDYNLFYGHHPASEPSDAHKLTSDPMLAAPGTGGTGRDTVDGYKLQVGSPCIDSGMTIADSGGQDYWGNPVPTGAGADRGAHEYRPPTPSADFSASPTSGPPPLTVAFTDLSTENPTSWSWDFGDGAVSTEQNPSHEYTLMGVFDVSLTAENAGGADTETKPEYIAATFPDVPLDHWAYGSVRACYNTGMVAGYPEGVYHPDWSVSRDQMAVFVSRALAGGDENIPTGPAVATFSDVPTDHWAFKWVEYAHANGIVAGYDDGTYRPTVEVDRGQMAVFIARAIATPSDGADLESYTPPSTPTFPDVPADFWAYKYVEYIVGRGVVNGYDDGTYRPDVVVTRDQMAVYIQRAFDLPV